MAEPSTTAEERCSWCRAPVEADDGYRLFEPTAARHAIFCRLEHLVPWAIRGPRWEPDDGMAERDSPPACAQCGEPLGDVRVLLVRHRGEHRVPDAFCSVGHARQWAQSGGRYR